MTTSSSPSNCVAEIAAGERFEFGANWWRFLAEMNEERITAATSSLATMLGVTDLNGKTFLDAGSGSGLFSLAARRLGAKVRSFDFDPQSVACTRELHARYCPEDSDWVIDQGSVLDHTFLDSLGRFDVVYSWGVLHHTGSMWQAIDNTAKLVRPGGQYFIAIYNDQGWISKYWRLVKRMYNASTLLKWLMIAIHAPYLYWGRLAVRSIRGVKMERGMSLWYDMMDWLGGYPFEVSSTELLLQYLVPIGFKPQRSTDCGRRMGCNEVVLGKDII